MKRIVLAMVVCAIAAADLQAGKRRALLVGINDYTASRLGPPRKVVSGDRDWADLGGTHNDVATLREMLVERYEFAAADIAVLTDQDATRAAILRTIDSHLVRPASNGDVLLFYFAGHGSQRRNSLSDERDRMDESLVPADSRAGADDIRDKELRPMFNAMLDRGARLTVILDKCNSGSGARGLPSGARPRGIRPDLRDVADGGPWGPRPEARGALVLAAAQDFARAYEMRDDDDQLRGAFTWALLRAMRDSLPGESAGETFLRARSRLRAEMPFQEPVLAGIPEARHAALLDARPGLSGDRAIVAVERVRDDGTVVLQGGWVSGLSVGSELRVISDRDVRPHLIVTALVGANRSEARAVELPAAVRAGVTLEVVRWASPPGRPLRLCIPRVSEDTAAIATLARRLFEASADRGVRWVTDPIETTPSFVLRRTTKEWELLTSSGDVRPLGANVRATIARLPRGSSLFVQFGVPDALADAMAIDRSAASAEDADYILAGRYVNRRLEYAWVRPNVTSTDQRRTSLPLRSDWIGEDAGDDTLRRSAEALRSAALRLRRIHGWTLLESPPHARWPLRLALRHTKTGALAEDLLRGGDRFELVLRRTGPAPAEEEHRYVYVFAVDSFGASTLLYPHPDAASVENRVSSAASEIRLGREGTFQIAEPYGIDTYYLLTSDEALANPWVIGSPAVRSREPSSPSALETVLMLTAMNTRSGPRVTPGNWSLERVVFESVPP